MLTIDNQTLNKYSVRAEKLTEAVEKKATETIKKYVFEVTGVSLSDDGEYKILLKVDANLDTPHADGFIIDAQGNDITITGKTQMAVVYAAFAFAEECLGVKFLTADCEIVPKKDVVKV